MRIFSWVTKDTNINFMGARKLTYALSALMVVLSIRSEEHTSELQSQR